MWPWIIGGLAGLFVVGRVSRHSPAHPVNSVRRTVAARSFSGNAASPAAETRSFATRSPLIAGENFEDEPAPAPSPSPLSGFGYVLSELGGGEENPELKIVGGRVINAATRRPIVASPQARVVGRRVVKTARPVRRVPIRRGPVGRIGRWEV